MGVIKENPRAFEIQRFLGFVFCRDTFFNFHALLYCQMNKIIP